MTKLDFKDYTYTADETNTFCNDIVNAIYDYYNDYLLKLEVVDTEKNGILDFNDIYNNDNVDINICLEEHLYSQCIYFRFKYDNILHYYALYSPEVGKIYDKHYCKKLYEAICKYIVDKEVI